MNTHVLAMAHISSRIVGNIPSSWIYAQWAHETEGFTSELCIKYHNYAGLTQISDNGLPQPDGSCFYMAFDDDWAFASYFGRYLRLFADDGIFDCNSVEDYIRVLKDGGYFGDSYENYLAGVKSWLASIR